MLLYPHEHACYMHEIFIDLPTERHPILQAISSYISSNILSKYMYNFSIHVRATHQQGCKFAISDSMPVPQSYVSSSFGYERKG